MQLIKSGFASFVGKPNVGKSSIINAIMKKKVVIVSEKPQTTRNRINVIYTTDDFQIVFVDTPGIHKPLHRLGEYMVKAAVQALKNVDLLLFTVDAKEGFETPEEYIIEYVNQSKTPVIGVINKIDLVDRERIDSIEEIMRKKVENLKEVVKTSAVTGEGLDKLLEVIVENLPEGPQFYPEDIVVDRPLSFIVSELIREKIFHFTYEEVPHSVAVIVEEIKERENGVFYIRANIYVERESQKGIIIGQKGQMIKKIGESARKDIEYFLESKVYLDLFVKVKKDWRNKDFIILNEIGMRDDLE
ncbi:GTP-binding protein Era [Fervidobacterium nodosum Rt17-B1]|uniref:GTPase Era n=1 Tax=Fervidobacterium nodosum (strain ATCC 35602 / DSM 5306 / Rt17-B1) TaxID=381764 RepID=A7HKU3_FERNB|nr:GTP-binding protein Era [Fervidobacterium nodosum Rt17-B1]PHJ13762.1 GTPase Era [Fervidobacterium sp. SC_NGM5_G05]